ncbi:hypothetical protein JDA50_20125 [Acinetobacter pittii]|jgi:hypothetical protein|nr:MULTISPECIES: hypothetical protein [Acinetobacter]EKT9380982.1 hypothetical protein [Acinetobacter baumannii]ENW02161.1 hypothetical protein F938_00183 [Acinetobacter bereziniae LMG 1003 = CIP 70.12]MBK1446700.1 hypothetical protein [Acinetobacter pittii]MCU4309796.1 hypothetical protein [Acinetobacter radioresistens]MCU4373401.1 hypothetical protein [Acinetobacter ursingii]NWK50412.1 hypothetical protein [Acinetobacter sp. SwsAc7]NWK75385.1 hypothetical protein [Acinetobacter sp. SwsAc6]
MNIDLITILKGFNMWNTLVLIRKTATSKEIKDKADMYLSQLNTATISASLKAEILSFIESVLND